MGRILFATLLIAGIIFSAPVAASTTNDGFATTESGSARSQTAQWAVETIPGGRVEIVAADYCYAGSIYDPATGETVDLFVLCAEDGLEQNLDLA